MKHGRLQNSEADCKCGHKQKKYFAITSIGKHQPVPCSKIFGNEIWKNQLLKILLRNFTPQAIVAIKSHTNSEIHYHHKIEIADSRNMKICNKTKLGVLNPNPWSEISYEEIFKISKTRPFVEKVYCLAQYTSRSNCIAVIISSQIKIPCIHH